MTLPVIISKDGNREFPCFPAAVVVCLVDRSRRILFLSCPGRRHRWETINGMLEAGETLLEGAIRETLEEAGPDLKFRPLGLFHASSFHYDENVKWLITLFFLFRYIGGPVLPGDDMAGAGFRWMDIDEIRCRAHEILLPGEGVWLFERALECYDLWKDRDIKTLQADLDGPITNKYD